ncbi:MAG: hypothetical protein GY795_17485 [Desulfobacterales bacterium]|nr:hypothetical protein [Desulfobacterales bacterium]
MKKILCFTVLVLMCLSLNSFSLENADAGLTIDLIPGQYIREPAANGWHTGTITLFGSNLKWTNEAGASWTLIPDLENEQLLTTDDCPYPGINFTLVLNENSDGNIEVEGFYFLNEFYTATTPVNNAPVADSQSVSTVLNQHIQITLTGSDADGDSLSYQIESDPQHGTLYTN